MSYQLAYDIGEFSQCSHTTLIVIRALSDCALVSLVALPIDAVFPALITLNPQTCNQNGVSLFDMASWGALYKIGHFESSPRIGQI